MRLVLLQLGLAVWANAVVCSAAVVDIETVLSRMEVLGSSFNPDALRQEGAEGLERLLDSLFPQTVGPAAPAVSDDEVARLIGQLGSEDFKVRSHATKRLIEEAESFRGLVGKATRDPDPEVRARARSVLQSWDSRIAVLLQRDLSKYGDAFSTYLDGMSDAVMLAKLARRTRLALEIAPAAKGQRKLLSQCVSALVKSGSDQFVDPLVPLLRHEEIEVAAWIAETVGSRSGNRYYPRLLLEALKSDRNPVVDAALSWSTNCHDRGKSEEVRRAVTAVFESGDEALKFHACFPLMHSYGDRRAIEYLLSQTKSPDRERSRRAIAWIGDACNSRRKAFPSLLDHLSPFLTSKDRDLRRLAADALGTYQGAEVVEVLIPLLDDPEGIIRMETGRNLLGQKDKKMLRQCLERAVAGAPDEGVREAAKELLEQLAGEEMLSLLGRRRLDGERRRAEARRSLGLSRPAGARGGC